ncbi:hypothetical protein [Paenibacillus tyrfis]|uniref:Uncharacterized protein n=1 Tax=Paenibacillus tyrfis TaxID=1501230 RepID=A0A081P6Y4_9BACL|nr:hypothetical protein [Paenibacillus tyrfis]KEQ26457.1 hypothetical protein ET33_31890 [Paenibacillus tyrfis]
MNNKKRNAAPKRASARTVKSAKRGAACHLRPLHPAPHMNTAQVRGLFSPAGIGGGLGGFSSIGRTVNGVPGGGVGTAEVARGAGGGGGFLSFFNSVGGLDGILSTMGKVQKMFTIVKQVGPIFKLFSSFGGLGGLFGGGAKVKSLRPPAKAVRTRSRTLAQPARTAGAKRTAR